MRDGQTPERTREDRATQPLYWKAEFSSKKARSLENLDFLRSKNLKWGWSRNVEAMQPWLKPHRNLGENFIEFGKFLRKVYNQVTTSCGNTVNAETIG